MFINYNFTLIPFDFILTFTLSQGACMNLSVVLLGYQVSNFLNSAFLNSHGNRAKGVFRNRQRCWLSSFTLNNLTGNNGRNRPKTTLNHGTDGTNVQTVSTDAQTKHNPRNYITRTEIGRKTYLPKLHNLV